jgi:hypothetical protein
VVTLTVQDSWTDASTGRQWSTSQGPIVARQDSWGDASVSARQGWDSPNNQFTGSSSWATPLRVGSSTDIDLWVDSSATMRSASTGAGCPSNGNSMTGGNWQDTSASIGTSTAAWAMGNGPEVVVDWQGTSTFVETGWNPPPKPDSY